MVPADKSVDTEVVSPEDCVVVLPPLPVTEGTGVVAGTVFVSFVVESETLSVEEGGIGLVVVSGVLDPCDVGFREVVTPEDTGDVGDPVVPSPVIPEELV